MPDPSASAPTTVAVPLWQGSSIADADRIAAGTAMVLHALGGDDDPLTVESPTVESLAVPDMPRGGAAVEATRQALARLLADLPADAPLRIVGGDCSADLAALQRSLADPGVRVLWLDAHADANTAMSSPSGAPHGMVARTALADAPDRLVYLGVRATDPEEARWIAANAIPVLPPDAATADLLDALDGAAAVHVHLDLDVLDPMRFASIDVPEPHGVRPTHLAELLAAVVEAHEVRCASITECSAARRPRDRERDLATLVEVLAPLR